MLHYSATTPGGWVVVAAPGCALLLDTRVGAPVGTRRLLDALRADDPIPAALDLLAAGGFGAMPEFALIEYRGHSGHYVVRGAVALEFDGPDGPRSASGEGVTTWSEHLVSGIDRFAVHAGDAASGASGAGDAGTARLPLIEGAVWASAIEWGAGPDDEPAVRHARTADAGAGATGTADVTVAAGPEAGAAGSPTQLAPAAPPTRPSEVPHETLLPEATVAGAGSVGAGAELDEGTTGYDHLFGITVMKNVEAAAVRPVDENDDDDAAPPAQAGAQQAGAARAGGPSGGAAQAAAASDDDQAGDHDGLTMMSSEIAELRRRAATAPGDAARASAPENDGANYADTDAGADEPAFRLELSDGRSEALDRPVIVGRAPSANKVSGAELPRLLTVGASDPDISRNHVRFTVEGGTVVITDLHSRNGTTVTLPGRTPQKLREGEPTSALAGTVVDLGGGIRITVARSA